MNNKKLPSDLKIYLSLVVLWVLLIAILPRNGKFNYNYRKGSPWTYETFVAQFDFPIIKTEEQMRSEMEAAGESVIPYFRFSQTESRRGIDIAENLQVDSYPGLKSAILNSLSAIYSKGVLSDENASSLAGHESGKVIFVQKDKRASKVPASEVYTVSSARAQLLADVGRAMDSSFEALRVDSFVETCGAYDAIVPNLIFDRETTELVHAETADFISPTMGVVSAGTMIVEKGEIVTSEIAQMLDSYKAEYENSLGYGGPVALMWVGNILISLLLVLVLFLSLYYTNQYIFDEFNRFVYLLLIFLIAAAGAVIVENHDPDLLYLTPFTLTALYLLAFFRKRVVMPVYTISLIPLLIVAHNGVELFVMYLVAGIVTMYVFQYFNKGWMQFVTALIAFASLLLTFLAFCLLHNFTDLTGNHRILYLLLGSLLSVAGYPLIYLFEKVFSLVSNSRLLELCDTNGNKLLKELAAKAPGTFQHCLQVMNMSDAAADAIGANVLLARTGSLYHDIGKISNPQCFVENAAPGANYHEGLSPQESAKEIIRHVTDGMALAEKYNLPQVVRDFIVTHHGTTCTGYFYNRYINDGGDPENAADFRYPGPKPKSKEHIIVMLCDTLEAASRTLKSYDQETIDAFVDRIVASKMDEGQFDDSDISLRDLGRLKTVLKSYLAQIYHERIQYPKRVR